MGRTRALLRIPGLLARVRTGVIDPAIRESELDQCQRQDDEEEQPRHRGGVAHPRELECVLEEVIDVKVRRVVWTATGSDVRQWEDRKRADDRQNAVEDNRRR